MRPSSRAFALVASRLALLLLALAGCPKRPPPSPAVTVVDAGASELADAAGDDVITDAATLPPLDAWVPERPSITLKVDYLDRGMNDAPRLNYTLVGFPALSNDGQRVVVTSREMDRSNDPSLRLVILLLDEREESTSTLQSSREYREALYPPTDDYPSPGMIDAEFRKLDKAVQKRIADANKLIAPYEPLRPCRIERLDEAGVRVHATCVGLSVTYEQHHLRVAGSGGRVRLDRSVAAWKSQAAQIPGVATKEELEEVYGDGAHDVLVLKFGSVAARYYGALAPTWHVIKLGP